MPPPCSSGRNHRHPALAFGHTYGLPTLAFRFFNVYGPLQPAGHAYAAVIPAFLDAALRGQPLTVHGDGEQTRDFTYVGTVARVIADAVVHGVSDPDPVNLAFGSRTSLNGLIDLLTDLLGFPTGSAPCPPTLPDPDAAGARPCPARRAARCPSKLDGRAGVRPP